MAAAAPATQHPVEEFVHVAVDRALGSLERRLDRLEALADAVEAGFEQLALAADACRDEAVGRRAA